MRWAVFLLIFATAAQAESLASQVNKAIDRGVANLRTLQQEDGSFKSKHHKHYPTGATALAVYAMAKSGVMPDDKAIQRAITFLRNQPPGRVYGTSMLILALDSLKRREFDPWIRESAEWLEGQLHKRDRIWAYGEGTHIDPDHTDLSNTQLAVLGLWTAQRHGHKVKQRVWREMVRRVPPFQVKFGAFKYKGGYEASGSMTTAGITVLTLALQQLPSSERKRAWGRKATAAVEEAWKYLDSAFAVKGNPIGRKALKPTWHYYYLYGLERVAALANRKQIGGRDWYREGARYLVAKQKEDGNWADDLSDTSFALLFLRRATFTQLGRKKSELTGETKQVAKGPTAPEATVPFLRRWLVLGPFEDPDDTLLEIPVIKEDRASPRAGKVQKGRRWVAHRQPQAPYDLEAPTEPSNKSLTYAFTYLHVAKACDAVFWFGHDDGANLYLDGKPVYRSHLHTAAKKDSEPVPVRLEAGVRRVLLKVHDVGSFTGFYLRLADRSGKMLPGVVPSLSAKDPQLSLAAHAHPGLFSLPDLLRLLPLDKKLVLKFGRPRDLDRVACEHHQDKLPVWFDKETQRGDIQPHKGGRGMLLVHCLDQKSPGRMYRKVPVPRGKPRLVARVSSEAKATKGNGDTKVRLLVYDGTKLHTLADEVVKGWKTVEADLTPFAGREVLVILETFWATDWYYDHVFVDEFSIR